MTNNTVIIDAYLKVPLDKQGEVALAACDYAAQVRQEEGNISFEVATNGRGEFFFWEKFKDESAFEVHKETEHLKNWRNFYEPFLIERKLEILKAL